jgi:hypothetical protein
MFYKFSSDYFEELKQIIFFKKLTNRQRLNNILVKVGNVATTAPSLWQKFKNIAYNHGLTAAELGITGWILYELLRPPRTVQVPSQLLTKLDKEQQDKLNFLLSSNSLSNRQKQKFIYRLTNKVSDNPSKPRGYS